MGLPSALSKRTVRRSRSLLMAVGAAGAAAWLCSSISGAFVGGASLRGNRGAQVQGSVVSDNGGFDAPGFYYEKYLPATYKLKFYNDVGYLPDGTAMHLAGNALNHPETIGPDLHTPGSALPEGALMNTVGYLPDGTLRVRPCPRRSSAS